MELIDQVCSLELAKELKELGVKQESLVYWLNIQHCVHMKAKENGWEVEEDENGNPIIDRIDYRQELGNPSIYNIDKDNCWSAFTVAELGEMLPRLIASYKEDGKCFICCQFEMPFGNREVGITEADARAKMLIYLLENGLIKNDA